jgi:hypothetical protein
MCLRAFNQGRSLWRPFNYLLTLHGSVSQKLTDLTLALLMNQLEQTRHQGDEINQPSFVLINSVNFAALKNVWHFFHQDAVQGRFFRIISRVLMQILRHFQLW